MKYLLLMAFTLQCSITVGNYRFKQVNEVRIEKSWRSLGNTATIKLPRHVSTPDLQTRTLEEFIKVGDKVSITLFYLGKPEHVEFEGYVRRIKPNIPFELECEDEVYLLRKVNINKNWNKIDLKGIISYVLAEVKKSFPQVTITQSKDIPSVDFKQFPIENANAAQVIEKLKKEYGLTGFFRNSELFVGLAYQNNYGTVKYSFAWNVIENDLVYRDANDIQLKVEMIGITKDNKRVPVTVGDADGEHHTFFEYDVTDKEQLKVIAQEKIQKLKYSGFEGTLNTFLIPYAEPLMTAELRDPQYDEKRSSKYVIDSVVTEFGTNGARRDVELGIKVNV